ncbi:MAG: response regulator [Syntrophobacteraceae bacterium]|nr:response regulator [Syntrophobacteraceae bacterium]
MKSIRLAVIEDEESHFKLIRRAIVKGLPEADIFHFRDVGEFFESFQQIRPDIILVDYQLPGINGMEFLDRMRAARSEAPIIMITGQGDEQTAVQAMKAGAADYMVKRPEFFLLLPGSIEREIRRKKERMWAERSLRASHSFLEIANRHSAMGPLLDEFAAEIQRIAGCDFAGIRIPDDEGNVVLLACAEQGEGFPEAPSPHSLPGMCVNIVTGAVDSRLPCITKAGSFYTNDATRFFAEMKEKMAGSFCLHCERLGYKSIALMPVWVKGAIMGLIHVGDHEKNKLPLETVSLLENAGMVPGSAISRVQMGEALGRSEKRLGFLSARLLQAQEEERKKIAREVHDSIGSSLSAIKLGLQLRVDMLGKGALTAESLGALVSVAQSALDEARRIMADLRPAILDDMGLLYTVTWLCAQLSRVCPRIRIEQVIEAEESDIGEHLKIVIFRIFQEALNNIAKHSLADRVEVSLINGQGTLELIVRDNGRGFDGFAVSGKKKSEKGLGLTSMRERTELSGGSFSVKSSRGMGTIVRASWPAEKG